MLCLTLTGKSLEEDYQQYSKNKHYIDLVELRIDLLDADQLENLASFPEKVDCPVILTCRRVSDGGKYAKSERTRFALLKKCLTGSFTYIDIEEDIRRPDFEEEVKNCGIKIIRSFHDIHGMPGDIFSRITKLAKKGDIAKIAVTPKTFDDVVTLFSAAQELSHLPNKIIIGMGDFGIPTRILYRKTGSLLTFCSADGQGASGHLTPEKMKNLFRADSVNEDTRIFGIIGNPVMHTSSPGIHNPGFHTLDIDAVYVPFLVDNVRSFFKFAEHLPIEGFSVTVPHKQAVLPYLGRISREVKLIGSCNTVVREGDTLWKGMNTDYYGFLKPVQSKIESGEIQKVVVIGAGGAARAVVWALRSFYCKVTILNRTVETAKKLALETGSDWGSLQDCGKIEGADLIVQTTNMGMSPFEDVDPIDQYEFTGSEIVYDLVYKPELTKVMARAKEKGCSLIAGMEMLLAQGVMQFYLFSGFSYPEELKE